MTYGKYNEAFMWEWIRFSLKSFTFSVDSQKTDASAVLNDVSRSI